MAKYISFNVMNSVGSGAGGAQSTYQDGISLVRVDQIQAVSQAAPSTATIQLDAIGGLGDITVVAGTTNSAASVAPTSVSANLKHSIQYAMSANPGGVIASVSPGFDTGVDATAGGITPASGLRMYWRSFIQG